MANTLEPNELPGGFQSTGDPVDGNPFLEDHPKHHAWAARDFLGGRGIRPSQLAPFKRTSGSRTRGIR